MGGAARGYPHAGRSGWTGFVPPVLAVAEGAAVFTSELGGDPGDSPLVVADAWLLF